MVLVSFQMEHIVCAAQHWQCCRPMKFARLNRLFPAVYIDCHRQSPKTADFPNWLRIAFPVTMKNNKNKDWNRYTSLAVKSYTINYFQLGQPSMTLKQIEIGIGSLKISKIQEIRDFWARYPADKCHFPHILCFSSLSQFVLIWFSLTHAYHRGTYIIQVASEIKLVKNNKAQKSIFNLIGKSILNY